MTSAIPRNALTLVLLMSSVCLFGEAVDLDRDEIRNSILNYRERRSSIRTNVHDWTARKRIRRQAFPSDDEDLDFFDGSGEVVNTDYEPLPPDARTEVPDTTSSQPVVIEWVWYRCSVQFVNSIDYTSDLQDYKTTSFQDYSDKIMVAVEEYLYGYFGGYLEATPLMFSQTTRDRVEVLIDVGACSSYSEQAIEAALLSLLTTGEIGDLAVTEDGFSMRQVGTDTTRKECLASGKPVSTSSTTTQTTEPTPPSTPRPSSTPSSSEIDVVPSRRPFACREDQATCQNGECIDRRLICDGNRDCSDGSDEPASCGNGVGSSRCDPTEFFCVGTGVCAQKLWRCDGDDDCGDGYDELNCPTAAPGSLCRGIEFECASDSSCLPASYQCDGENDCVDSSDERGCSPPFVTRPPTKLIRVRQGETVTLDCVAAGTPTPLISWRLNWGNVGRPPRVTMSSSGGRGVLTIKDVRTSDQGAYTCEAINSEGSIFAIPDAVVIVEGEIESACPQGQFGPRDGSPDLCRPCYCFGVTNQCEPSQREYEEIGIEFDSPKDLDLVGLEPAEVEGGDPTPVSEPINKNQIVVNPAARELQLIDLSKRFLAAAHYWSLPAQFLGAKINSYGGTLKFSFSYNTSYGLGRRPTNQSDVILEGANGKTLVYHDKGKHPEPETHHQQSVRITEDDWTTPEGEPATREEMLNTLNNLDKILLRTVYDNSMLSTGIGDVTLETASRPSTGRGVKATSVEECICPEGYEGLSCQYCSPGYERITVGPFIGNCEKIIDKESEPSDAKCDEGYTGTNCAQCAEGYVRSLDGCVLPRKVCDKAGSYGVGIVRECNCKAGCQGRGCDSCKPGYFFLSEQNIDGCLRCFCMGLTNQCRSSALSRSETMPSYDDEAHFLLTNVATSRTVQDNIRFEGSRSRPVVVAHLGELPRDVYYWKMPKELTGNKITSYGGRFRYTINYSEATDAQPISRIADVRITGNDITLVHKSGTHPAARSPRYFEIMMTEEEWFLVDDSPSTRENMLMALADIDSFSVRATYSSRMLDSMISDISLETADERSTGRRQALEVEQCSCPEGYTGLSCEDCAQGYHRSGSGAYLGYCIRCSCNGHSDSCDELTGECNSCQHYTEGNRCERCIVGFYGDPRIGSVSDCKPCPCPLLPSRSDRSVTATCSVDVDGQPRCHECPPGFKGRLCDRCADGLIGLPPACRKADSSCQCDPNGSMDGTCDSEGRCNCKESVEGTKCDSCKPSYFYFSVENVNGGCLPCFCMGVTRQCRSSSYARDKVTTTFERDFGGFALTDRLRNQRITGELQTRVQGTVLTHPRMNTLQAGTYYWQLPDAFLGDKIVSYGGELKYTISYTPYGPGVPIRDEDIIIIGNDIMLVTTVSGTVEPRVATERSVLFREENWRRADGRPATREHLLMALADLEDILIRATYSTSMLETAIKDVSMETAAPSQFGDLDIAYEVEQCTCPNGYEGLSCEDCSPGYTRSGGGLYLGQCLPCQCNDHADVCDPETGDCVDCRDNTIGRNCERCASGFYSMSRDPASMYCEPCACPLAGYNSFSATCEYNPEIKNLVCNDCQEGYTGSRCENCAEGYEGNPRITGGKCTRARAPGLLQSPPEVTVSPPTANVLEGKSITISCDVRSTSPVRVMWRRVGSARGRPIPESAKISDSDHSMTLVNFARDDAGIYECIAQNQGGQAKDRTVLTVARQRPMIKVRVEEPTRRQLRTGSTVSFVCTASSKMPAFIISWSKRGGRLPKSRATDFNGILHIEDLVPEDSGTYVCTGSNMYEIDQETATLLVVRDSDAVRPSVTIDPSRQSVREGEEAVFHCSANGTPPMKIEWRPSSGEYLPDSARIIDGELHIPSVDLDNSAVFYCRASNSQGMDEATALLDVTALGYKPLVSVVSSAKENRREGEHIQMRCSATGMPRPLFSWKRLGSSLPSNAEPRGGSLLIMNVKPSNEGIYVCTARNAFGEDSGQIQVNIEEAKKVEKPVCKTDPETMTAYVGAEASITCVVGGDPPPTVTWVRSDGRPLQSNVEIKEKKLIIHKVTPANAGRYMCIATNIGGTTRSEMTLTVEDKQLPQVEILPRRQQVVEVGDSASFTCEPISGHPVEVTWIRTDRKPFTDRTKLAPGGVISFTDITLEDGGSYICIARNVVGYREVATLLNVIRKPSLSIEPSTQINLRKGDTVKIRCMADGIPAPNVAWKKMTAFGQQMIMTTYKRNSNEIWLRNVQLGSSAKYICVAVSAAGNSEQQVTVTVGEKEADLSPAVTVERPAVSGIAGKSIQLRCVATGQPEPSVEWSKKYSQLPQGSFQRNGVLTIPKASADNAGEYVCSAQNTVGSASAITTLEIIVPPELKVTPSKSIMHVSSGQSAVATCSAVAGTEPITIQWSKAIGAVPDGIVTSSGFLKILSFEAIKDAGIYTCTASNQAGKTTIDISILPIISPSVTVSPEESKSFPGDLVSVQCEIDTEGDAVWSREDGMDMDSERVSQVDGVLTIRGIRKSDSGRYKCTATNSAGSSSQTADLIVQERPIAKLLLSVPEGEVISVGDRLEITCEGSGSPEPTFTLTKNGKQVLSRYKDKVILEPVLMSDAGTYVCIAVSEVGIAQEEVLVEIQVAPSLSIIPDSAVVEVQSGEELALSCIVTGSFEEIVWSRENADLPSSSALSGNLLQIDGIMVADSGDYICSSNISSHHLLRKSVSVSVRAYIPYFTQSPLSYISLSSKPEFYRSLRITVSIRPYALDGLVFYSYGSSGDYISLALLKGKVEFRYNVGSGDAVIVSENPIELSQWHTITVSRHGREGQLMINELEPVRGTSEGSFEILDLDHPFYLGGYPTNSDNLPPSLSVFGQDAGFYGCISQLIIGDESIDLGSSPFVESRIGIVQCKICGSTSEESPCQHDSSCLESHSSKKGYICGCSEEYVGPECQFRKEDICGDIDSCGPHGSCTPDYSRELGYRCQCYPGYVGPKCLSFKKTVTKSVSDVDENDDFTTPEFEDFDSVTPVQIPRTLPDDFEYNLPDEDFDTTTEDSNSVNGLFEYTNLPEWNDEEEAKAFGKDSYMQLDVDHKSRRQFEVSMTIKPVSLDDGLLLYNSGVSGGKKRAIDNADIFVSVAIFNGSVEFRYNCGSGTAILRSGTNALNIGVWNTVFASRKNRKGTLKVNDEIHSDQSPRGTRSAELNGPLYVGGVKYWERIPGQVGVRDGFEGCIRKVIVNGKLASIHYPVSSKNVKDQCLDIATTSTNLEISTSEEITTENSNNAMNDNFFSSLFLIAGEENKESLSAVLESSGHFGGDSYVTFPGERFPHNEVAEQLSLYFRTIDVDGLLVLHGRADAQEGKGDFILLGLQNARLQYTFRLGESEGKAVSTFPVSDGQWHRVIVVRRGSLALMWIDDLTRPVAIQAQGHLTMNPDMGEVYIGGAQNVAAFTGGRYNKGFRGCLRGVRFTAMNQEQAVQIGATYLDDTNTPTLLLKEGQGRTSAKDLRKCGLGDRRDTDYDTLP